MTASAVCPTCGEPGVNHDVPLIREAISKGYHTDARSLLCARHIMNPCFNYAWEKPRPGDPRKQTNKIC